VKGSTRVTAFAALILFGTSAVAEEIDIRLRGRLSLDDFDCSAIQASLIRRVCYDDENRHMLIQLGSVWYHYCDVPDEIVTGLLEAESASRYFNAKVRGRFGCRTK
jgi:hypothetical protein